MLVEIFPIELWIVVFIIGMLLTIIASIKGKLTFIMPLAILCNLVCYYAAPAIGTWNPLGTTKDEAIVLYAFGTSIAYLPLATVIYNLIVFGARIVDMIRGKRDKED